MVFFREIWLFGTAYCWIYVAPLLLLPTNIKDYALLFIAFFLGLTIDVMYDKPGVNAAACVALAYLRPWVIKILADQGNDDVKEFNFKSVGFRSFSVYVLILLFVHHLTLFLINAASSQFFFKAVVKTFASVGFTYLMIVAFQMLYYARRGKR